jgi:uncharacterized protein YPO0396
MKINNRIHARQICEVYDVPPEFIDALTEYQLMELEMQEDGAYIAEEQLAEFEKLMRLHFDLNINYEGLDVIQNLMRRIDELEHELRMLRNRL